MKLPSVNAITQQEFLDHIEDDDFLLKYGNPVAILAYDGSVLMCMAIAILNHNNKAIIEEQF